MCQLYTRLAIYKDIFGNNLTFRDYKLFLRFKQEYHNSNYFYLNLINFH